MRAYIAVHRVFHMQGDADIQRIFFFASAPPVENMHVGDFRFRGPQRAFAYLGNFRLVLDPKNSENRIADELQNLAAAGMNRSRHGFEIVIKDCDQLVQRIAIRQ